MRRIAVTALLLLTLAACGSSGDSAGSGPQKGMKKAAPAQAVAQSAGGTSVADVGIGRAQIREASMTVRVDDVAEAARAAVRVAEGKGGFLESEQTADDTTTLTVRVPPEDFTATSDLLARLGTVTDRTVSTEDVTSDVADVAGRLKAARASVDRVRALLARATTISEITDLETELNEREAALESLETRRRSLEGQTAFAALTATFTKGAPVLAAKKNASPADTGFGGGLRAGWRVFAATVAILLVILGAVLPFAAVALLVAVPLYVVRRRRVSARA